MKLAFVSALSSLASLVLAPLPAGAQNQFWIRQLGTSATDQVFDAAPDGSGGVYVSGETYGSLGGPSAGGIDAWLARYDGAGNQAWIRQLGTSAFDTAYAAAPDGSGGVFVGGTTDGSLGGPNAGPGDAWLARFDGAGNPTWMRQFGTISDETAYAAAPDGSSGVFVVGASVGPSNDATAWLARYDGMGTQVWIRYLGTPAYDFALAAAPDGSGGVFVGGQTQGNLGGTNAGNYDAWLARYDGAGVQKWIRQLGTSAWDYPTTAAPDGSGGVFVGGWTEGDLGAPNAGLWDAWLARYDSAGNLFWICQLGTSSNDRANGATPDGSGGVYVSGSTVGSLGGPNAGGGDVWLARYDGAGNQTWIRQLGTSSGEGAFAAAPDDLDGVFVGGATDGSFGGAPNAGGTDAWLARYVPDCGACTSFCTAKSGLACGPVEISAIGTPSASAGSGFLVSASPARTCKSGILLYNVLLAPAGAPFQGGTLCVSPQGIRRAGATNSLGTPGGAHCDGAFTLDLNAFARGTWVVPDCTGGPAGIAPHTPAGFLGVPGQSVFTQLWGRDSVATGSYLSAGLAYVVAP